MSTSDSYCIIMLPVLYAALYRWIVLTNNELQKEEP